MAIPQLNAQIAARGRMRRLARAWQAKVLALAGPAVKRAQLGDTITILTKLLLRVVRRAQPASNVLPDNSRVALARRTVLTVPPADIRTVLQQQPARLALLGLTYLA
jgi:hypothetical protein